MPDIDSRDASTAAAQASIRFLPVAGLILMAAPTASSPIHSSG
jgi:hypothetical protein